MESLVVGQQPAERVVMADKIKFNTSTEQKEGRAGYNKGAEAAV